MKFAVSIIDFFSNDLRCYVVDADSWKGALIAAHKPDSEKMKYEIDDELKSWLNELSDEIEIAKQEFFDGDQMFEVIALDE